MERLNRSPETMPMRGRTALKTADLSYSKTLPNV